MTADRRFNDSLRFFSVDSNPAFQRRVSIIRRNEVPSGTEETRFVLDGGTIRSLLSSRDGTLSAGDGEGPSVETLGYFRQIKAAAFVVSFVWGLSGPAKIKEADLLCRLHVPDGK
jgi:hypothetical protein